MTDFVGLTWDHPRGRHALEAAAARVGGGDSLRWEVQPLEGFESAPIDELAAEYDLLVLDHPHLGDALATDSLTPIDELFDDARIAAWSTAAVGPSLASYRMDGHLWALPLDAATQVCARVPALVPEAPRTWEDVRALGAEGLVALSVAGPHAFLSLCSLAVALGDDPGRTDRLFDRDIAGEALELMAVLSANAPDGTTELNPIGLLDRMRDRGDIGCVPLVYGYVTYSSPRVAFSDAPHAGERIGSTIGGTGIAVSRRRAPSPALLEHLAWLLEPGTQTLFIPTHDGQPSAAAAWEDEGVDAAASGFYSSTRATIDQSWIRPRFAGYIPFQSAASAIVRNALASGRLAAALDDLQTLYTSARASSQGVLA